MEDFDDSDEQIAELAELYLSRLRAGEKLSMEAFVADYPELKEELFEVLPALVAVEGLGQSETSQSLGSETSFPEYLGGYRLIEKIGRGGMGTVFRALQVSLQREVAVKILAPSWNDDERLREAFEKESRVIASLRHTHIVEVYGAGHEGDLRYYVMGLVRGESLSEKALRAAYPQTPYKQAVAQVGLRAAKAIAFAHYHGVLHRDIKPGNLMLDKQGQIHVTDFGLATILNSGEAAPLVTQNNDGTLRYMAPERLLRQGSSYAADQYALGLTLYELMQGHAAYNQSEPGQLIRSICEGKLPWLREHGELGAIINKSISYDPKMRYASMQEMVEDLSRYLEGRPVRARAISAWRRYRMWTRRRPAVAIWSHVAALCVLLVLCGSWWGYLRERLARQRENELREHAERNATIADDTLKRIFSSMLYESSIQSYSEEMQLPSRADVHLMQDLLPYYDEIAAASKSDGKDALQAKRVLASIALKMGDYKTAEEYFRTAMALFELGSAEQLSCINGLATALFMQGKSAKKAEALELLNQCIKQHGNTPKPEVQFELLRSLLHALYHSPKNREEKLNQAANLLRKLRASKPGDSRGLMAEYGFLRLLEREKIEGYNQLISPDGNEPLDILDEVLGFNPQHEEAMRAYLRLALDANVASYLDWPRVVSYAQSLLANNISDTESIYLFLAVRSRYSSMLEAQGESLAAELENERTLGILSFLTSRADFAVDLREDLIMMVARRSVTDDAQSREQQDKELRLLMNNYDSERAKQMRQQVEKLKKTKNRTRGRAK